MDDKVKRKTEEEIEEEMIEAFFQLKWPTILPNKIAEFDDKPSKNSTAIVDQQNLSIQELFHGRDYVKKYRQNLKMNTEEAACNETLNVSELTGVTSFMRSYASETTLLTQELNDNTDLDISEMQHDFIESRMKLPIYNYREEIISSVQKSQLVIISGATGCGKSTQVPQYIYDSCVSQNDFCNIIICQPRKIAARTLANRVSLERGTELGKLVGYQIGLDKQIDCSLENSTRITFCTTGVVLQKLIREKSMRRYSHIILDEVHERDLDMDFLITVIRRFLTSTPSQTKIIFMSATMNVEDFKEYFKYQTNDSSYVYPYLIEVDAPRLYEIKENYLEDVEELIKEDGSNAIDYKIPGILPSMYQIASKLIYILLRKLAHVQRKYHSKYAYNILVFLPGIYEIERMKEELNYQTTIGQELKKFNRKIVILHSQLSSLDQQEAFSLASSPKIILASNIAESSLTIPNVLYVVDFCLTKYFTTEKGSQMSSLVLDWATRNNLQQRAGRAGRVCKGSVYRLIHRQFYFTVMRENPIPEILLTPLESVIVKIKKLDMGTPLDILAQSMDPPDMKSVVHAVLTLKEHGGLLRFNDNGVFEYDDGILTFLGNIMSILPCDIRISKLIVLGYIFSVLEETLIIGAGLSIGGIFLYSMNLNIAHYVNRVKYSQGSCSDCITLLNAYRAWIDFHVQNGHQNLKQEESWCKANLLNLKSLKDMQMLIEEMKKRLSLYKIECLPINQQPIWHKNEKDFIIKTVIAGAFGVANFFIPEASHDLVQNASKLLDDFDNFRSVYFTNMDSRLFGDVYEDQLKTLFVEQSICQSKENVSVHFNFNSSERVVVTFEEDKIQKGPPTLDFYMGKVAPEVYKALKYRTLCRENTTTLNVMSKEDTFAYADEMGLGVYEHDLFTPNNYYLKRPEICPLPTLSIYKMKGTVTFVESCDKFFFRPEVAFGEYIREEGDFSYSELNSKLQQIMDSCEKHQSKDILCGGQLILFNDNGKFVRARFIEHISRKKVAIQLIDNGGTVEALTSDIYLISNPNDSDKIDEYPSRAFECKLKEIQPSIMNLMGKEWTPEAIDFFRDGTLNKSAVIDVYSLDNNDVVVVELFTENDKSTINWNNELILRGFAQECEESLKSKLSHQMRKRYHASKASKPKDEFAKKIDWNQVKSRSIKPPAKEKCLNNIYLAGPFSPLETTLHSIVRETKGFIRMDPNSVNHILLKDNFLDLHEKFYVAANVTFSARTESLKLRETTEMPNIPGLAVLLALIFCPTGKIRRDADKSRFVSILTGLGYDDVLKRSIYPERDASLLIDFELSVEDVSAINHLRFAISSMLFTDPFKDYPDLVDRQREATLHKIKDGYMKLIKRIRPAREKYQTLKDEFKWNTELEDEPKNFGAMGNRALLDYIAIPKLQSISQEACKKLMAHLKDLECESMYKLSSQTCKLCSYEWNSPMELKIHLLSKMHNNQKKLLEQTYKSLI